jgi:hypothetical protein
MAGRREPTFGAPDIAVEEDAAEEAPIQPAASAVAEPEIRDAVDEGLSIAALDEVAGRREPTFDPPVRRESAGRQEPASAQPVPAGAHAANQPRERGHSQFASTTPADHTADAPQLSIAALDQAAGRKEPTFDEPVRRAQPAATTAAPRIPLRPIETRIEARRIDTLRADPVLSAPRPIFPHIEPEEWDVPPMIAAQARQERRGTGWAIGLGTLLLIAGITAPAAIWQQGRQVQDEVALVTPAPAPQQAQTSAPTAETTAQPDLQAPTKEAPVAEAPQPETPPPAPAIPTQEASTPTAPNQAVPRPETEQATARPQPTTPLGAINDGGDVSEAPVVAPPPPMASLASKGRSAGTGSPMVARPFVPEQDDGPFLRAPTTGTTTVPVVEAPAQSTGVGAKPNLIGQLKPKPTMAAAKPAASKPRPVVRKPKPFFQQSPEQMFETLVETLSEGKPANPATKPASPSSRR